MAIGASDGQYEHDRLVIKTSVGCCFLTLLSAAEAVYPDPRPFLVHRDSQASDCTPSSHNEDHM